MLIKNGCSAAVFFVLWISRRTCAAGYAPLHSCYGVGCTQRCRRFALPGVAPPRLCCCAHATAFAPPISYHRACTTILCRRVSTAVLHRRFCAVLASPGTRCCTCVMVWVARTPAPVPRCRCARTTGFALSYLRRNNMPRADNKPCLRAAFFKILCL